MIARLFKEEINKRNEYLIYPDSQKEAIASIGITGTYFNACFLEIKDMEQLCKINAICMTQLLSPEPQKIIQI